MLEQSRVTPVEHLERIGCGADLAFQAFIHAGLGA